MTRPPSTVCKPVEPSGHCRRRAGWLTTPSSTGVTTDRSTNTADTTMLDGLLHGGCKWISGVAVDNDLFLPRHSMQLAIHPHRRFSRKCGGHNPRCPFLEVVRWWVLGGNGLLCRMPWLVHHIPPRQSTMLTQVGVCVCVCVCVHVCGGRGMYMGLARTMCDCCCLHASPILSIPSHHTTSVNSTTVAASMCPCRSSPW